MSPPAAAPVAVVAPVAAVAPVAVVTGAARGIGRATAAALVAAGCTVVGTWHQQEPDESDPWHQVHCDVSEQDSVDAMVAEVERRFGPVTVVVANAAVLADAMALRLAPETFRRSLDVNLLGAFRVAHAALPHMLAARWGRIVLVSSVGGFVGSPGQANYAAGKTAMVGLARSLAAEAGSRGVTVNVVAPGLIDTELMHRQKAAWRDHWVARVPLRRQGQPAEVAAVIAHLTSPAAAAVTGAVVAVDGGFVA